MGDPEIIKVGHGGKISIMIVITGEANKNCLDSLKAEIERAAKNCDLKVKIISKRQSKKKSRK